MTLSDGPRTKGPPRLVLQVRRTPSDRYRDVQTVPTVLIRKWQESVRRSNELAGYTKYRIVSR